MFILNYTKGTRKNGYMVFDNENDAINTAWGMHVEKFADNVTVMDKNGNIVYHRA